MKILFIDMGSYTYWDILEAFKKWGIAVGRYIIISRTVMRMIFLRSGWKSI